LQITFKKLSFRNFASFGNKTTELVFTSGLNLISGSNGVGKSSLLLDALSFVLYGKPYRKIKKLELINRTVGTDCWVKIEFNRNNDDYIIERGLKPNILKIIKNGKELELLSALKFNQDEIDKIIGINHFLFKQIISTASSNNKSFLSLSAWEKRNVIESVFNLQQISEMLNLIKIDKSENKIKLDNLKYKNDTVTNLIKSLENQLEEIDSIVSKFEDDKKEKITENKKNLLNMVTTLEETKERVNDIEKELSNYNKDYSTLIKQQNKSLNNLNKNVGSITANLKLYSKNMEILNNNEYCPVCKSAITEKHKSVELKNIKSLIKDDIKTLDLSKENIEIVTKEKKQLEEDLEKKRKLNLKLKNEKKDLINLSERSKRMLATLEKIKNEESSINSKNISEMLNNKNRELNDIYEELNEHNENATIFDILIEMFGDTGIKTEFYNMIIPLLNKNINKLLIQFELPIIFNFDYNLNYTIKSVYSQNENINYYSFSEGEKKRIDLALMLSFITLNKMISNWDSNLLIADELFTNMDKEGIANVIQSLKDIVLTNNNTCLYIVSHNLDESTEYSFDNKILIIKDDGFSRLLNI